MFKKGFRSNNKQTTRKHSDASQGSLTLALQPVSEPSDPLSPSRELYPCPFEIGGWVTFSASTKIPNLLSLLSPSPLVCVSFLLLYLPLLRSVQHIDRNNCGEQRVSNSGGSTRFESERSNTRLSAADTCLGGFRFGVLHARQTRVMAAVDDGRYARYGMQVIEKMSREIHDGAE